MLERLYCSLLVLTLLGYTSNALADAKKSQSEATCLKMLEMPGVPKPAAVMQSVNCLVEGEKYARAAYLLQKQLEEMDQGGQQGGRKVFEDKLQAITAKIATYDVHTENAAEVVVDGHFLGQHPQTNPLFLQPGSHTILVRHGKKQATKTIEARPGTFEQLDLVLVEQPGSSAIIPAISEIAPPVSKTQTSNESKWTRGRIAALTISGALGIAGLAWGIGYTSGSRRNEQERAAIVAAFPLGNQQCNALPDLPDCDRVKNLVNERNSAQSIANIGFVMGGISLTAAVATLVWPAKKRTKDTQKEFPAAMILPRAGGAEINVIGSF